MNKTTGFIDVRKTHPMAICGLLLRKLGAFEGSRLDRGELARRKNRTKVRGQKVKFGGAEMIISWPSRIRNSPDLGHLPFNAAIKRIPHRRKDVPRLNMRA